MLNILDCFEVEKWLKCFRFEAFIIKNESECLYVWVNIINMMIYSICTKIDTCCKLISFIQLPKTTWLIIHIWPDSTYFLCYLNTKICIHTIILTFSLEKCWNVIHLKNTLRLLHSLLSLESHLRDWYINQTLPSIMWDAT